MATPTPGILARSFQPRPILYIPTPKNSTNQSTDQRHFIGLRWPTSLYRYICAACILDDGTYWLYKRKRKRAIEGESMVEYQGGVEGSTPSHWDE